MITKKIKSIEFGVLSPEMIRKMSAVEISRSETYDKDGFPIERGLMDLHLGVISPGLRCKTCGQTMKNCPGHFGHIELIRPIIHPKFGDKIQILLSCTCKDCGRVLAPEEKINELMRIAGSAKCIKELTTVAKEQKKCPHCGSSIQKLSLDKPTNFFLDQDRLYPSEIQEWVLKIPEKDQFLFGYSSVLRPQWFVLTVLPVSSVTIRPSLSLENVITSEDDLTHMLLNVVRINVRLQENISAGAPQIIIEDLWDLLQYNITTYIDNNTAGVPPAKHRSGRALNSLAQRLKGKKGRFRYNLIGKRVNAAARTTITPSTDLKINELGVPQQIADTLTMPEKANSWNIEKLRELILKGKVSYIITKNNLRKIVNEENKEEIAKQLEEGITVRRKLQDGDLVIFNRQPTLHRVSIMGHYVKVLPGKTYRINPISCEPYNADFDGDEMNMHCPQTESSYAEIENLMVVDKHIFSIRHGGITIKPDHDIVTGAYLLTKKGVEFTKKEAMEMLYSVGITELPQSDCGRNKYSGKLVFSQILPKDLNVEYENKMCTIVSQVKGCKRCTKEACKYDCYLKINKGQLVSGVLDEKMYKHKNLIEILARSFGRQAVIDFYYKLSKLVFYAFNKKGLTIALDEYKASKELKKDVDAGIKKLMATGNGLIKKYEDKTLSLIPGKTLTETFEASMINEALMMKDEISSKILAMKLEDILNEKKPAYNNALMLASIGGARGRVLNVVNILGLWGQVTVRNGRPMNGYSGRLLSLNRRGTKSLIDHGFVKNSLYDGFTPREYFCHSIGGRQGEIDTGVATKVSGYLYRRLANSLKDLIVNDELMVKSADGRVVQFLYGDDGLSPDKAYLGKNINFFHE